MMTRMHSMVIRNENENETVTLLQLGTYLDILCQIIKTDSSFHFHLFRY